MNQDDCYTEVHTSIFYVWECLQSSTRYSKKKKKRETLMDLTGQTNNEKKGKTVSHTRQLKYQCSISFAL